MIDKIDALSEFLNIDKSRIVYVKDGWYGKNTFEVILAEGLRGVALAVLTDDEKKKIPEEYPILAVSFLRNRETMCEEIFKATGLPDKLRFIVKNVLVCSPQREMIEVAISLIKLYGNWETFQNLMLKQFENRIIEQSVGKCCQYKGYYICRN